MMRETAQQLHINRGKYRRLRLAAAFLAGMAVTAALANISVAAGDSPAPRPVEAPAAPVPGIGIAGAGFEQAGWI